MLKSILATLCKWFSLHLGIYTCYMIYHCPKFDSFKLEFYFKWLNYHLKDQEYALGGGGEEPFISIQQKYM